MSQLFAHACILTMINLMFFPVAHAALLSWRQNTETDLAGYRLYYGEAPGSYGDYINLGRTTQCALSLLGLTEGVSYYICMTAYDYSGNESDFSDYVIFHADDGIPDDQDNCPATYNPDQEDNELDGWGDACDQDDDNDEVDDGSDNCPYAYNTDQEDRDGDGRGDACDVCPLAKIFGAGSAQVASFRYLRDNVLSKSSEGLAMIELYYRWSPAVVKAIEGDAALREEVREIAEELLLMMSVDSDRLSAEREGTVEIMSTPDDHDVYK